MHALLSRLLILFAILGLIVAPPLFSANAEIRRADSALAVDRPLDAVADLEHASLLLFWRADLKERAGRAAFAGGDMSAATRLLSQAESLSGGGWRDLGEAYFKLERFEDSVRALQHGLEVHDANAALYRQFALTFNAQGDFESEMRALQSYLALDDREAAAHHRLGLLLSIYDPESAFAEFTASVKLDEAYAFEAQTMRSALSLASIQANETDRLVAIGRGLGLISEWQLAREAFLRASLADGQNAEAWAWLGEAEQHLGQGGGEELERAVTLNPFSSRVRALYGLYWKRHENSQKALAQFQWAAAIEPQNPTYQAALADAFVFNADLPSALVAYQRAAGLAPNEVTYWRLLALFCSQYSFQAKEIGVPAAQKVLSLMPDRASSYDLLGWSYFAAGVPTTAEINLLKALRLDEKYAPAHLHLAMVYLETGKMEEARKHLLRARTLDLDGASGQAAEKLMGLYFP